MPKNTHYSETQTFMYWFQTQEDLLKDRANKAGVQLTERLLGWRTWIGDAVIYINELRNLVEAAEEKIAARILASRKYTNRHIRHEAQN